MEVFNINDFKCLLNVMFLLFRVFATIWATVFAMNVSVMSIKLSSVVLLVMTARYEQLLSVSIHQTSFPFSRQEN